MYDVMLNIGMLPKSVGFESSGLLPLLGMFCVLFLLSLAVIRSGRFPGLPVKSRPWRVLERMFPEFAARTRTLARMIGPGNPAVRRRKAGTALALRLALVPPLGIYAAAAVFNIMTAVFGITAIIVLPSGLGLATNDFVVIGTCCSITCGVAIATVIRRRIDVS